ncbi:hypothetical protein Lesp02_68800 [Lentzea sp. NBRC 105346]|uniref:DUF3224 domain-containing protein n=1 Tax=Lentzea sp. NBRC 105346 TaxID=3032205 RepID=UPI0024A05AF4|nr:DUF3224 domain-containing protein [Lentzea sp. NBRC 105346]GLZ34693.1 hypothetical protein Lesp02_68800 [Lentzea sp. NBRC 105346]
MKATGTIEVQSWDEQTWDGRPYTEVSGAKLTMAVVTFKYTGDIEGTGTCRYLMSYDSDTSCETVGLEEITGRIGSRSGTFVLRHVGAYRDGKVTGSFEVVGASGELAGMRGAGGAEWAETTATFTLEYDV